MWGRGEEQEERGSRSRSKLHSGKDMKDWLNFFILQAEMSSLVGVTSLCICWCLSQVPSRFLLPNHRSGLCETKVSLLALVVVVVSNRGCGSQFMMGELWHFNLEPFVT